MSIERFGLDPDGKLGLSGDDVIAFQERDFGLEKMTKLSFLLQAIQIWSSGNTNNKGTEPQWFVEQGLSCEILRIVGGGWQKGRFRIRLEFIPSNPDAFLKKSPTEEEKPESPLDDLRSKLNPE